MLQFYDNTTTTGANYVYLNNVKGSAVGDQNWIELKVS